MARPLTETMSWEEITEKIMFETGNQKSKFKSWLLGKKYLGGNFFNSMLYGRCYGIQKSINYDDKDHFIVISGYEGSGKSTLGIQVASIISPTFSLKNICFRMSDFARVLGEANKGDTIILDEGNLFLFNREYNSDYNRIMVKVFALMRQKNLCIIICVPNLFTLDSYVRDHRINTLIHCHGRGKFCMYIKAAIKIISKEGCKLKKVRGIRTPSGTYSNGYWNKNIPEINDITEEAYKGFKGMHFNNFLREFEEFADELDNKHILIPLSKAQALISLDRRTMIKLIKEGKIKGKTIGGKWFVHRPTLMEM